jgi:hypothetical protein
MNTRLAVVVLGVAMASTGLTVAESGKKDAPYTKISPEATELISTIKPAAPPPHGQQGNYPQGQFPPGQGPNHKVPSPAQVPSGVQNQPVIPSPLPESAGDAANHSDVIRAAAEAQQQIEALRPGQDGINLGILDADDARGRGQSVNPDQLVVPRNDPDMDAAVEALLSITETLGSNSDNQSEQTRGYSSLIERDPGALLAGARAGMASDNVTSETVENTDGTTTETTKRHDHQGNVIQQDVVTRDGDGTVTQVDQTDTGPDGVSVTHSAHRTRDGDYSHTVITRNPDGSGSVGPTPWRSPDWWANVDPDSPYGQGRAWVPGQKAKAPKVVEAQDDGTPGGRPPSADDQGVGGGPRLNVNVNLVGQPDPDRMVGGSAVGAMFKNPNDDTIDPPRPIQ